MSSEAGGKGRTAMRTTGILAVALTTVMAMSAVDTLSLAEAGGGGPRNHGGRNAAPTQATTAPLTDGGAGKTPKDLPPQKVQEPNATVAHGDGIAALISVTQQKQDNANADAQ
jgi:hypothetical protein